MFIGRVESRALNVLLRLFGIVVTLASAVALVLAIADIIRGTSRDSIGMMILIAGLLAFGGVLLRMRSFRPDGPEPSRGERVTWWTGDSVK
jgi:hypothetical protein